MAFDLASAKPLSKGFDVSTAQPQPQQPQQQAEPQQEDSFLKNTLDVAGEFAAAINKGVVDIAEFFTTDQINAVLELSGSEKRVTPLSELPLIKEGVTGGFMEEGFAKDVVTGTGAAIPAALGAGTALRSIAQQAPAIGASSLGQTIAKQMGAGTASGDVALGALGGTGAEVGRGIGGESGAIVGSILAPIGGQAGVGISKLLFSKDGIRSLFNTVEGMSKEGASIMLAESMVRDNLGPDDVLKRLDSLGKEGLLADVGENFTSILKAAANRVPRVAGQQKQVLDARNSTSGSRILSGLDDATGLSALSADDEIIRLNKVLGPKINELYASARSTNLEMPEKIAKLISDSPTVAAAAKTADNRLADRAAIGEGVGTLDKIDAIKGALDDSIGVAIRQGENSKVRELTMLKNSMVNTIDNEIPVYKQARDMFAGKATLENATDLGRSYLKVSPRELKGITETMGESELRFFKLGAKEAIVDRFDKLQENANVMKRIFGKNGDVQKLKTLFNDPKQFKSFNDVLQQEANFAMTRASVQGNSSTPKQILDVMNAEDVLSNARDLLSRNPAGILGKVLSGLSDKKGSQATVDALSTIGDVLLTKGMPPAQIQKLLSKGTNRMLEEIFRKAIKPDLESSSLAPISAVTAQEVTN